MARTRTDPFWVDEQYDADQASNRVSRLATYIRRYLHEFHADDPTKFTTDPVDFAAAAFYVTSPPILAPGYVRTHPRVLGVGCDRSDWDGDLLATVQLAAPRPEPLQALAGFSDWVCGLVGRFEEPDGDSLSRRPAMLTTVRLLITIRRDQLYVPKGPPQHVLTEDVKAALQALIAALNEQVTPVLDVLDA